LAVISTPKRFFSRLLTWVGVGLRFPASASIKVMACWLW
jgi:hypothetical protein